MEENFVRFKLIFIQYNKRIKSNGKKAGSSQEKKLASSKASKKEGGGGEFEKFANHSD